MFPNTVAAPAKFDIGRVISRVFGVIGAHAGPFLLCSALLAGLPNLALGLTRVWLLQAMVGSPQFGAVTSLMSLASVVVGLVAGALLQAAIVKGTVDDLNGRPVSIADCITWGVSRLLPLMGVTILTSLAVGVGFVLLFIPGVIAALMFAAAVPVATVEQRGVIDSISRSVKLTENNRLPILGLFVIYFIFAWVIGIVATLPIAFAGGLAPGNNLWLLYGIAQPIAQTITSLVGAAGIAAIYFELRGNKEGVGAEAIASVFS